MRRNLFIIAVILFSCAVAASQQNIQTLGNQGKIDHEAFAKSVPFIMNLGEGYTIKVPVTNTGSDSRVFGVLMMYNMDYLFFNETLISKELKKDESHIFEFRVTPHKSFSGEQKIEARLYLLEGKKATLLDADSDSVFLLQEKTISFEIIILLGIISLGLIIAFNKYLC